MKVKLTLVLKSRERLVLAAEKSGSGSKVEAVSGTHDFLCGLYALCGKKVAADYAPACRNAVQARDYTDFSLRSLREKMFCF